MRFLWTFARCCGIVLALSLMVQGDLEGQTAGKRARAEIYRLLGDQARGEILTLKISRAALADDVEIKKAFEAAKKEIERQNRIIDAYQEKPPDSPYEWGQYLNAFNQIIATREGFQELVRGRIATKRPSLDLLVNKGVLDKKDTYILNKSETKNHEVAVLNEIAQQINVSEQDPGNLEFDWPDNFSPAWRPAVEKALRRVSEGAGEPGEAVKLLRQTITILRTDLGDAAVITRETAKASRGQLSEIEEQAILKLAVLAEMQLNVASNAIAQHATIERRLMAEEVYGAWQGLHNRPITQGRIRE